MTKKWNRVSCEIEAKKFKRKYEWFKNSKGSYEVARINGWLEELSLHMKKEIKPTKICNKCKKEKERSFFNKDFDIKNGLRSICKDCQKISNAKYRNCEDKERKKILIKDYQTKNRERINARVRKYRIENPEKVRAAQRKESRKKLARIEYKLAHSLRSRLYTAIKRSYKSGSAVADLGCSIEFLKKHLESQFQPGMSWENYGKNGWHIDHKKPLSSFDLESRDEFLIACHYTNLQPLWEIDNLRKYNKLDWKPHNE